MIEKRIEDFENMAFGMFIHWGLYSLLGKGEWIMEQEQIPGAEYRKPQESFAGENFDAEKIARLAAETGMKYAVLTTRHHEGFSLYDTKGLNSFDSIHSPAGRDFTREFAEACRAEGIKPFFYHTTLDWMEEDFEKDFDRYLEYLRQSVEILCTEYGEIGGFWFDGNWSRPDADWKLDELYGMIRRLQPNALIINNTGLSARGELGHPEIDSVTFEQGLAEMPDRSAMEKYVAGEMCCTLNDHWGFGKNDLNYKSPAELIRQLCRCRRAGANFLLNVGPDGSGAVPAIMQESLRIDGRGMRLYGPAVYEGRPDNICGEADDFGLKGQDGEKYLFCFELPIDGNAGVTVNRGGGRARRFTGIHEKVSSVRWMDNGEELSFEQDCDGGILTVNASGFSYGENYVVRVAEVRQGEKCALNLWKIP